MAKARHGEERLCSVSGCASKNHSRGLCNKHYLRWRNGDKSLHADSLSGESDLETLFLERIRVDSEGCWMWEGARSSSGNLTIRDSGVVKDVKRLSMEMFGKSQYGYYVRDCARDSLCVSPYHLSTEQRSRTHLPLLVFMTPDKIREFWEQVDMRGDACWTWKGSAYSNGGYGRFRVMPGEKPSYRLRAHRIALCLKTGKDYDTPLDVLHSCDNPPCVNPDHLRWGTPTENINDIKIRDRRRTSR